MLVLLSPAKTLNFEKEMLGGSHTLPLFIKDSSILIERLRQLGPDDIASLMNISENLACLNYERFRNWQTPFTPENAKAAILAFTGHVYEGLNAREFDEEELSFAQKHLKILSGLYGILRPLDLIQPYRLEMGTALDTSLGKNLYTFWGASITEALNEEMTEDKDPLLINLASEEYFKAIKLKLLKARVITPVFKEFKGGKYKIISFNAKIARGLMSNYIIKNRIRDPQTIKSFNTGGYSFDDALSSSNEWIFTR